MALSAAELQILINARDNASATLRGLNQALTDTEKSATSLGARITAAGQSMQSFGSSMMSAGRTLSMAFTAPILAAGGAAVYMASNFGAAMEQIHTQAGASQAEVQSMSAAVLDLAKTVPVGPEALATGLYHVESLGLRGAQALDVLKFAAEGAALSGSNLEDTASALGAVIQSGIGGVHGYADAMGQLNGIVGAGNMRMQDLVTSLSSGILGVAREFGVSLRDIGASMDVMADSGVPAIDTTTRLRMSLAMMAAPTAIASKYFKELGLDQLQLARDLRQNGLLGALQDLKAHLDAFSTDPNVQADILARMFGGGRSSSVVLGLINQLPLLQQKLDVIDEKSKTFGEDFADYLDLPAAKWKQFIADVQADAIKLGNALLPLATQILEDLQPFLAWLDRMITGFQRLPGPVQGAILAFVALLAAIGPVSLVLGMYISAVGTIVTGAGALVSAITAGADAFVVLGGAELAALGPIALLVVGLAAVGIAGYELGAHWSSVWSGIQSATATATDYIVRAWYAAIAALLPPVPPWAQYVVTMEQWVVTQSETAWAQIESSWDATWGRMPDAIDGPLQSAAAKVRSFAGWAAGETSSIFGDILGKAQDIFSALTNPGNVGGWTPNQNTNLVGPPSMGFDFTHGWHTYDEKTGQQHWYDKNGNEVPSPFRQQGRFPEAEMPPFPQMPSPSPGGGAGGIGGAGGGGRALTQAQQDLLGLAAAFAAFHAQTGGTIFDFEVMLKLGADKLALDQKQHDLQVNLAAATMENNNAAYQLEATWVSLAETAIQKGETIQQATRDLFDSILKNVQSVFAQVQGGATVEGTQLQLQIDQLQLQADILTRAGATTTVAKGETLTAQDRALKAIEDQVNALKQEQKIRQDQLAIDKDRFELANHLLQTDQQQFAAMQFLDAAMAHLSATVQDLDAKMGLITGSSGGHAMGGIAAGWSLVGEQGPELAYFAQPARIYPAGETQKILSGASGATTNVTIEQHFTVDSSMSDAAKRELVQQVKEAVTGALVYARVGGSQPPVGAFA